MALTKIKTDGVTDDAITSGKIPANAVGSSEIAANSVGSSELADDAVDTDAIQDNAVTAAKLADVGVIDNTNQLGTAVVTTTKIADETVTLAKLEHGTSSNDGKFLRANNGADPTFETVSTTPADGSITQAKLNFPVSNRNIMINGAMIVAQRGTSSTVNGYGSVDRMSPYSANTSVTTTHSQVAVTTGGAYDAGFRKAFQVTKPAGSVAANGQIAINYSIEGQDIVNSGWKMTDPNSKLTLSFWVKSSVSNHNPTFYVQAYDTPSATQFFNGQVSALTADTWTKVTTVIPGHADIGIANDNTKGLVIGLNPWYGTDFTDAGNTNGAWTTFGTKPVDSTWLTTNNSTFQITGYQLEVGSVATDFEHRSYAQELQLCKRYYTKWCEGNSKYVGNGLVSGNTEVHASIMLPVTMRGTVAIDHTYGNDYWRIAGSMGGDKYIDGAWIVDNQQPNVFNIYSTPEVSLSSYVGDAGYVQGKNSASYMAFSSEL